MFICVCYGIDYLKILDLEIIYIFIEKWLIFNRGKTLYSVFYFIYIYLVNSI